MFEKTDILDVKLFLLAKRVNRTEKIFSKSDVTTDKFFVGNINSSTQNANEVDRARGNIAFGCMNHMTLDTGSQVSMQTAENNISSEM